MRISTHGILAWHWRACLLASATHGHSMAWHGMAWHPACAVVFCIKPFEALGSTAEVNMAGGDCIHTPGFLVILAAPHDSGNFHMRPAETTISRSTSEMLRNLCRPSLPGIIAERIISLLCLYDLPVVRDDTTSQRGCLIPRSKPSVRSEPSA